jgi:hypothetical protein
MRNGAMKQIICTLSLVGENTWFTSRRCAGSSPAGCTVYMENTMEACSSDVALVVDLIRSSVPYVALVAVMLVLYGGSRWRDR